MWKMILLKDKRKCAGIINNMFTNGNIQYKKMSIFFNTDNF